jgi:hypothetical protein
MIRIKVFGQQSQNYFNVIEKGNVYTIHYARVMAAKKNQSDFFVETRNRTSGENASNLKNEL